MNTQSPLKSVSGPRQPSTKPAVSPAVVCAAEQAVVQITETQANQSRAVQSVAVVIDPPGDSAGPRDESDTIPTDGADVVPQAVSPVSLDEAMSLSLSPPQRMAIQLLTSGKSLVAAATAAGVNRTTLYRWLKGDAAFVAAYNAWQRDVRDTARGRILALSDLALTTVAKAMSRGDARTALRILEATGALKLPEPGSTDPADIERLQKLERTKAQTALNHAEAKAEMDAMLPL
jgi:hypothetical protein